MESDLQDMSKAALLNAALLDMGQLVDVVGGLYRTTHLYNAMSCSPRSAGDASNLTSSDAIHVDVRWLSEVLNDVNTIGACLAANDYAEARHQADALARGIAGLTGRRTEDDEIFPGPHSWENARYCIGNMLETLSGVVTSHLCSAVEVLRELTLKIVELDSLYAEAAAGHSRY